jgi:hypothetical protein
MDGLFTLKLDNYIVLIYMFNVILVRNIWTKKITKINDL